MKKIKKVSINLTQEEYDLLNALARLERRSVSELAALIVVDTSQQLFLDKQEKGTMEVAHYYSSK